LLFGIITLIGIGGGSLLFLLSRAGKAAQSANCASNMKAVCLAARLWASDRAGLMPTNFLCMSNELITPLVLHCSADGARPRLRTWKEFSEETSSYLMISPAAPEETTNLVFIRCRIH